jgi:hypothetical protein
VASSAATVNVSMSRVTSPRASRMGFPASMQRAIASSSKRSRKRRTQCSSTALRSNAGTRRIASSAATAAPIARSMSAACASATRVATSPVYLSVTSRSAFGLSATFAT